MTSPPPSTSPHALVRSCHRLVHEDIWHQSVIADRSLRGRTFALLRVLSITAQGTLKNKIFVEAAALGYYSLISLGPIISLAIIISTFFLQKNEDKFATDTLNYLITHIAPATYAGGEDFTVDDTPPATTTTTITGADGTPIVAADPDVLHTKMVEVIKSLVTSAQSSTVGVIGLLVLAFICIQLIVTIENTFNSIWGARRGRTWVQRVVLYWSVFTLGTLVSFAAGTLLSAKTINHILARSHMDTVFLSSVVPPLLSYALVAALLTAFYRYIPNTPVHWRPALIGGAIATLFLFLNNYLSFLYVNKVISIKSLFGSIGIFPVLMFGLYIFWLLVLLGGQLTYAVQNANFLTDDRLWNQVSPRIRRLLSLAAFLQIARTFLRREECPSADELAERLRVPGNILNECLNRLGDLKLIVPIECPDDDGHPIVRYQPGQPLHQLTLGEFHRVLDILGNSTGQNVLDTTDPVLPQYLGALTSFETSPQVQRTFAQLLEENPDPMTPAKSTAPATATA